MLLRVLLFLWLYISLFANEVDALEPSRVVAAENAESQNYAAISQIHHHLDDDRDGKVDISESDEFMKEELHLSDQNRHHHFHGNDSLISVEDLWNSWVISEVHNWTDDDVIRWLVDYVHLPQYTDAFKAHKINGTMLPRLATKQSGLLQSELGIKDAKHRKKISLRTMDIILFGPPASGHNFIKDVVVAFSVLIATVGCWLAVHQKRRAKQQLDQTMKDLKVLQQAEKNFADLQNRLSVAEEEHQIAIHQKLDLETRLQEELQASKSEAGKLQDAKNGTEEQMQRLKYTEQELTQVRNALRRAERELQYRSWKAPDALKEWLQMTYTKEAKHFQAKRALALKQMTEAKEACDRFRKKRNSFVGVFRMTHDLSIDEVDQRILSARSALAEVTNELEERQHRWSQIESLCGLQIMSNCVTSSSNQESGSVVAQVIANAANIGSVASGGKLSGNTPPSKKPSQKNKRSSVGTSSDEDLPPTYSSVTAHQPTTAKDDGSTNDVRSASEVWHGLSSASGEDAASGGDQDDSEAEMQKDLATVSSAKSNHHGNTEDTKGNHGNSSPKDKSTGPSPSREHLSLILPSSRPGEESVAVTTGANDSPSSGSKSKKRLSFFGGKRQESLSDGDSSNENDEESRRKKVKSLWKRAIRKSKAQGKSSRTPSNEKLKASPSNHKLKALTSSEKLSKVCRSSSSEILLKGSTSPSGDKPVHIAGYQSSEKLKAG